MTGLETLDLLLDRASADHDDKTVRILRTVKDAFVAERENEEAKKGE